MNGSGSTAIASGATLTISGGVSVQRQITVNGTGSWTAGRVDFYGIGAITNNGTFTTTTDNGIESFGDTVGFNNAGTFTKSTGTGSSYCNVPFNNAGNGDDQQRDDEPQRRRHQHGQLHGGLGRDVELRWRHAERDAGGGQGVQRSRDDRVHRRHDDDRRSRHLQRHRHQQRGQRHGRHQHRGRRRQLDRVGRDPGRLGHGHRAFGQELRLVGRRDERVGLDGDRVGSDADDQRRRQRRSVRSRSTGRAAGRPGASTFTASARSPTTAPSRRPPTTASRTSAIRSASTTPAPSPSPPAPAPPTATSCSTTRER